MENKVWDKSKPKMGIYTMSDTDITWPENLLWIYLLQKKIIWHKNLSDDHNVPGTENTHNPFFEDTNLVRILSYCFPTLNHDDLQWKSEKNAKK